MNVDDRILSAILVFIHLVRPNKINHKRRYKCDLKSPLNYMQISGTMSNLKKNKMKFSFNNTYVQILSLKVWMECTVCKNYV
jgi:hypothetical protein